MKDKLAPAFGIRNAIIINVIVFWLPLCGLIWMVIR